MINVSNEMYERPVIMDEIESLQFTCFSSFFLHKKYSVQRALRL